MKPVHWLLVLSIEPAQSDAFHAVMKDLIKETDREPGTMAYEWNFNDDGTVCLIYERFSDADAAMIHLSMFGDLFAERFLAACSVTGLTILGYTSNEVKSALKGFNPTVFSQRAGFARFAA